LTYHLKSCKINLNFGYTFCESLYCDCTLQQIIDFELYSHYPKSKGLSIQIDVIMGVLEEGTNFKKSKENETLASGGQVSKKCIVLNDEDLDALGEELESLMVSPHISLLTCLLALVSPTFTIICRLGFKLVHNKFVKVFIYHVFFCGSASMVKVILQQTFLRSCGVL
jgi:hypothetical protein